MIASFLHLHLLPKIGVTLLTFLVIVIAYLIIGTIDHELRRGRRRRKDNLKRLREKAERDKAEQG